MTEIHPTLVVGDGPRPYWLSDDGRAAPTVRELLRQYPSGTRVRDYFPRGRDVSAAERGYCITKARDKMDAIVRPKTHDARIRAPSFRTAGSRPRPHGNAVLRTKYDKDAVLNAWAGGGSAVKIEADLRMPPKSVSALIQVARQKGDPRALYENDPRRGVQPTAPAIPASASASALAAPSRKRKYDHDAALDMWAAGYGSGKIAVYLGIGKDPVRKIIKLARDRGDPRAVRRRVR